MTVALYSCAGYVCQTGLMDGEFKAVKEKLANLIEINTTVANEHVTEIERKICHVMSFAARARLLFPSIFCPTS